MAQLREAVQVLRRLWTHDRASFSGEYYRLDEAVGMPKPRQQPLPLWIGGQGEKSLLRLVAETADGWNMVPGSSVAQVQHKREVLERHCEAVGRDSHTLEKSLLIYTALYDTEREWAQLLADQVRLLGADHQVSLLRARELGLAGSAAHITDTLGRYLACGFDYLIALFPYTRERDLLQRYTQEIWCHLP